MEALPVSVVIAAHNAAGTIARAVKGAQNQRPVGPIEIIVVDDASEDHTADVAAASGARVIQRAHRGGASAGRNAGVREARGDWIATLDADDLWLPDHLKTVCSAADGRVLVSASALACGQDPSQDRIFGVPEAVALSVPRDVFLPTNPIVLSGALFRREVALDAGLFAEQLDRSEDLDLWVRMLEHGSGLALARVTVLYAIHHRQTSRDRDAMRRSALELMESHRRRTWWSAGAEQELIGAGAWDELRDALRHGERREASRVGVHLLTSSARRRGARRLLSRRAALRRRLKDPPEFSDIADALSRRSSAEWTAGH